jgi:hypothetical protein
MALQRSTTIVADDDYELLLDCCCSLIPGIHAAGACAQIAPEPAPTAPAQR